MATVVVRDVLVVSVVLVVLVVVVLLVVVVVYQVHLVLSVVDSMVQTVLLLLAILLSLLHNPGIHPPSLTIPVSDRRLPYSNLPGFPLLCLYFVVCEIHPTPMRMILNNQIFPSKMEWIDLRWLAGSHVCGAAACCQVVNAPNFALAFFR